MTKLKHFPILAVIGKKYTLIDIWSTYLVIVMLVFTYYLPSLFIFVAPFAFCITFRFVDFNPSSRR